MGIVHFKGHAILIQIAIISTKISNNITLHKVLIYWFNIDINYYIQYRFAIFSR